MLSLEDEKSCPYPELNPEGLKSCTGAQLASVPGIQTWFCFENYQALPKSHQSEASEDERCYFSAFPLLLFSLLCTTDRNATRSEWTINCLIIPVTPAHNEIFIPCLQQSLAEAVLLFLNWEELPFRSSRHQLPWFRPWMPIIRLLFLPKWTFFFFFFRVKRPILITPTYILADLCSSLCSSSFRISLRFFLSLRGTPPGKPPFRVQNCKKCLTKQCSPLWGKEKTELLVYG